jgi:hypothetical protein
VFLVLRISFACAALLLFTWPSSAEENMNATFKGVPASAFAKPAGTPPEQYLWGDGSGTGKDPNDGRLYHRRGAKRQPTRTSKEADWVVEPDVLAYLRDLDPETRLKVVEEMPPKDQAIAKRALAKIGISPLRDALRERLQRKQAEAAATPEEETEAAATPSGSGFEIDDAIGMLEGAASVLSAFGGGGGGGGGGRVISAPARATNAPAILPRAAAPAPTHGAPRRSGSDITGTR